MRASTLQSIRAGQARRCLGRVGGWQGTEAFQVRSLNIQILRDLLPLLCSRVQASEAYINRGLLWRCCLCFFFAHAIEAHKVHPLRYDACADLCHHLRFLCAGIRDDRVIPLDSDLVESIFDLSSAVDPRAGTERGEQYGQTLAYRVLMVSDIAHQCAVVCAYLGGCLQASRLIGGEVLGSEAALIS